MLRYLGAFGPASVKDTQTWCGLTRLRTAFERLAPGSSPSATSTAPNSSTAGSQDVRFRAFYGTKGP